MLTVAALRAVEEPPEVTTWIVCDGDVDPEWVESLNSVLVGCSNAQCCQNCVKENKTLEHSRSGLLSKLLVRNLEVRSIADIQKTLNDAKKTLIFL